jgi:hypothetical protein
LLARSGQVLAGAVKVIADSFATRAGGEPRQRGKIPVLRFGFPENEQESFAKVGMISGSSLELET